MDKKQMIADGKKKVDEQHSSPGENITPIVRRAALEFTMLQLRFVALS
jgi:hypothetical protein